MSLPQLLCNWKAFALNLNCLKKSLADKKDKWLYELLDVLWPYCKTKQQATGETHFSMAFSSKAIVILNVVRTTLYGQIQSRAKNKLSSTWTW